MINFTNLSFEQYQIVIYGGIIEMTNKSEK